MQLWPRLIRLQAFLEKSYQGVCVCVCMRAACCVCVRAHARARARMLTHTRRRVYHEFNVLVRPDEALRAKFFLPSVKPSPLPIAPYYQHLTRRRQIQWGKNDNSRRYWQNVQPCEFVSMSAKNHLVSSSLVLNKNVITRHLSFTHNPILRSKPRGITFRQTSKSSSSAMT